MSFAITGRMLLIRSLLVLLLSANTMAVAQAFEPDIADPALKACVQELVAKYRWTSLAQANQIKCHAKGIQSLKGLEAATNLKVLSLYNNALQRIDINLEDMPELNTLNLARNRIDRFELKNLAELKMLYLFDNQMQQLTLSALPQLEVLKAHNNRLIQFTYSGSPNLKKVYIFNNKLETVDIYQLPRLDYMDCRQNPMPDELYDEMDQQTHITFLHDGNAEDW